MIRPRTERMAIALARVAGGEKPYRVARVLGIAPSQMYAAVKAEREKANRLQVPAPASPPAPD